MNGPERLPQNITQMRPLILNPDNTVSETNTANIFALDGNKVLLPFSPHVLPGITQKKILEILSNKGYDISQRPFDREQFIRMPNVMVCNSLMGAVKVLSLDGNPMAHETGLCEMINNTLFV